MHTVPLQSCWLPFGASGSRSPPRCTMQSQGRPECIQRAVLATSSCGKGVTGTPGPCTKGCQPGSAASPAAATTPPSHSASQPPQGPEIVSGVVDTHPCLCPQYLGIDAEDVEVPTQTLTEHLASLQVSVAADAAICAPPRIVLHAHPPARHRHFARRSFCNRPVCAACAEPARLPPHVVVPHDAMHSAPARPAPLPHDRTARVPSVLQHLSHRSTVHPCAPLCRPLALHWLSCSFLFHLGSARWYTRTKL